MGMAPPPRSDSRAVIDNTRATPEAAAATDAANSPAKALQSPTLTDILMRDIVSGQVRTMRKGGRRGTFSGTAQSPYGTLPPLGG